MTDIVGSGSQVAPTATTSIAAIAAASLPAGQYDVRVDCSVSNAAAADLGNMKLAKTGGVAADIVNPLPEGVNGGFVGFTVHGVVLDGATNLVVSAIANATAAIEYDATITAVRVADRP